MSFEISNKVCLITGASSGIGRACAVAFHRAGARVAAAARREERLDELARELGGNRLLPVVMDVTDREQRANGLRRIEECWGPVDVLVNNAGWASFSTFAKMPEDHLDQMLALNLAAPVLLTQALLPGMVTRGSGQVINIASVVGFQAIPRMTVYSATKAALISLSTGLRMELRGTGVDVLMVAPGSTPTDFFDSAAEVDTRAETSIRSHYPASRVAKAVLDASRRRKSETLLTAEGRSIAIIRRFSRGLADSIMYYVAKRGMRPSGE